jgi:hypothetical protein
LEWDYLKETTQGHEEVPKPPLVKFVSKILLKILGIYNWGVGYILWNAFSQIEKNEEFGDTIFQCKLFYVRKANLAWSENPQIPPYRNEDPASPLNLKKWKQSLISIMRDCSWMIFIFKPFHYFKFNYFIRVLKLFFTNCVNFYLSCVELQRTNLWLLQFILL